MGWRGSGGFGAFMTFFVCYSWIIKDYKSWKFIQSAQERRFSEREVRMVVIVTQASVESRAKNSKPGNYLLGGLESCLCYRKT